MTTDLDLVVDAAEELDAAAGPGAYEIAGAVVARPVSLKEALGRKLGASAIACGETGAADPELARDKDRRCFTVLLDDQQLRIGDGLAEGDKVCRLGYRSDARPDCRLGGAIHVEELGCRA